jgi:hypothetical protein
MKISNSCKIVAIVALLAAGVGLSTTSVSARAPQVTSCTGKVYTVKATVSGGKNKTIILLAKTGRALSTKKLAVTNDPQLVTLKTPSRTTDKKVCDLAGATLQVVSSTSGDYFGPILLGWYGSSRTSATKVYTKFSSSAPTTIDLKTITIKSVSSKQGYGYTAKNTASTTVNTASASATKATNGKPRGVGNYGKAKTTSASSLFLSGKSSPMNTTTILDALDGGDADDDGLPNIFDVNDDGDTTPDSGDETTPVPITSGNSTDPTTCEAAASFHIFTNYKAVAPNFADTLNYYGTGTRSASDANIVEQVQSSLSMVFSPITKVCNETVTKMEIKGIGVSYAPASYVEVESGATGDIQWQIGAGIINNARDTDFSIPTFTKATLPSGQDTFMQRVTTTSGKTYEFTSTAGFIFVTHPMLYGYCLKTTGEDCVALPDADSRIDYTSSSIPPIAVAEDETLVLWLYRPQRLAIDGEPAGLYNLNGFRYTPDMPNPPGTSGNRFGKCDAEEHFDTESPTDVLAASGDSTNAKTLKIEWDLMSCFAAKSESWGQGTVTIDIQVESPGPGGNSAQKLFLTLI